MSSRTILGLQNVLPGQGLPGTSAGQFKPCLGPCLLVRGSSPAWDLSASPGCKPCLAYLGVVEQALDGEVLLHPSLVRIRVRVRVRVRVWVRVRVGVGVGVRVRVHST